MKKHLLYFLALFIFYSGYAQKQDTIRLLAIANSFSEDALENYLYDLAKAEKKVMIIGNMYIGGAPISLHVKNARENKAAYSYRKINANGVKTTTKDVSIEQAIKDEKWDYISVQQASPASGQYDVIMQDLPEWTRYIKSLAPANSKLIYHQTWAYQQDSNHKGFANYKNDQMTMYNAIVDVSQKINKMPDFAFVVPAGTAIQNARTSSIGDKMTRDGYHLELNYGRFTAACTWFEKIFKMDVRKNSYKPEKVSEKEARIAKLAAHKAVKKPYKDSKIGRAHV